MLLLSKTYETVTYESAEIGDAEERGFVFEDESFTFREVVDMLKGGTSSAYPAEGDTRECVVHNEVHADYRTGARTSESIHYSRANPRRNAKYWRMAFKAAGL